MVIKLKIYWEKQIWFGKYMTDADDRLKMQLTMISHRLKPRTRSTPTHDFTKETKVSVHTSDFADTSYFLF